MCFAHAHKQADAQQKGAHLEERAEQIARQSDTLLWQRGEGGMWRGGSRGRAEEGGGGARGVGGVQWSTLRHLKNENEKKKKKRGEDSGGFLSPRLRATMLLRTHFLAMTAIISDY